ncbi:hypothetical protein WD019_04055 [Fictibacillus sp. Mic-4]|uniref:hypothetical protein n=1 Tax=Fictibacillus sp. Mic-4 TaxID=3132826 RepID=UPI003CF8C7CC
MEKDKKNQTIEFDAEGVETVSQQIQEAYQSGVIDPIGQNERRTQLDEEESLD